MNTLAYTRVDPSVRKKLRRVYEAMWFYQWPYDDCYLCALVLESKINNGMDFSSPTNKKVYDETLILMRDNHHFPDHPAPYGSAT